LKPITVCETTIFRRSATAIMGDAEIAEFVDFIARNPIAGDIIEGTGGIRKLRWQRPGMGKRGGARIIYFFHDLDMPIYLLLAYAKADAGDITPEQKRRMKQLVAELLEHQKR
jgi:hypothetical protein